MAEKKLFLLDAYALIYRAHFAFTKNPRINSKGHNTSVPFGFTNTLLEVIQKQKPTHIAVAFDTAAPTFRDEIFKEYKAKRIKPPQEFYDQIPDVWEFLRVAEIPIMSKEGYEADDIIGTLAKKVNGDLGEGEVIIITGDQDTLQLVDDRTKVAMPAMGKIKETLYDISAVRGKLDLTPAQVIDYKALSGDPSDNIPGVRGIGEKTAIMLLKEFGSIEKIYEHLENKKF